MIVTSILLLKETARSRAARLPSSGAESALGFNPCLHRGFEAHGVDVINSSLFVETDCCPRPRRKPGDKLFHSGVKRARGVNMIDHAQFPGLLCAERVCRRQ